MRGFKQKRIVSWLLTLAMVLTMLPATALATEAAPVCGETEHTHTASGYPAVPSDAYLAAAELFRALPAAEDAASMTQEEQDEALARIGEALDAYAALEQEEQTAFREEHLDLITGATALRSVLTEQQAEYRTAKTLSAADTEWNEGDTFQSGGFTINASSDVTITVNGAVTVDQPLIIDGANAVTIKGGTNGGKLIWGDFKAETTTMFTINQNAALNLEDITVDGGWNGTVANNVVSAGKTNLGRAFYVCGTMTMKKGAVIQNCKKHNTDKDPYKGIVVIEWNGGKLVMEDDSLITNCFAHASEGATNSLVRGYKTSSGTIGNFEMQGGSITGNYIGNYQTGAVNLTSLALTVSGDATISGNKLVWTSAYTKNKTTENTPTEGTPDNSLLGGELDDGANVYLSDGRKITVAGALTGKIGINSAVAPAVGQPVTVAILASNSGTTAEAARTHFTSDRNYKVVIDNGAIKLGSEKNRTEFYVKSDGSDIDGTEANQGNGTREHPYATIGKAYSQIGEGQTGKIIVLDDLTVSTAIALNTANTVTIVGEGGTAPTVTRDASLNNAVVFAATAGDVTFRNITLDGNAQWQSVDNLKERTTANKSTAQFMQISDAAKVTLGDGAVIQNHCREITGNAGTDSDRGGAVYLKDSGASLTMKDGSTIKNCTILGKVGDGGAISVWNGAAFTMEGGTLTGNAASRWGGAIRSAAENGQSGAVATIKGGTITGNAVIGYSEAPSPAPNSGGVSITQGTVHVSGEPTITGNQNLAGASPAENNVGFDASDTYLTIDAPGLSGNASIGVNTSTVPTDGNNGDVKFAVQASGAATDAVKSSAQYFHSDVSATAGVLYCDGSTDSPVVSAGHAHDGNANTLWLSVAAKDTTVKTQGTAVAVTDTMATLLITSADGNLTGAALTGVTGASMVDGITENPVTEVQPVNNTWLVTVNGLTADQDNTLTPVFTANGTSIKGTPITVKTKAASKTGSDASAVTKIAGGDKTGFDVTGPGDMLTTYSKTGWNYKTGDGSAGVDATVLPYVDSKNIVHVYLVARNTTESAIPAPVIGWHADVKIANNDQAPIYNEAGLGFRMEDKDTHNALVLAVQNGGDDTPQNRTAACKRYAPGSITAENGTETVSKWWGKYSERTTNYDKEESKDFIRPADADPNDRTWDSGAAFAYHMTELAAGEVRVYEARFGVGDVDAPGLSGLLDEAKSDSATVSSDYDAESDAFTITVDNPTNGRYYGLVDKDNNPVTPTVVTGANPTGSQNGYYGPADPATPIAFTLNPAKAPIKVVASDDGSAAPAASDIPAGDLQWKGSVLVWSTKTIVTKNTNSWMDLAPNVLKETYEGLGYSVTKDVNYQADGQQAAQHLDAAQKLVEQYDLIFLVAPQEELNASDIALLQAYLDAGGRIVMQGEANSVAGTGNANLTAAAKTLGTTFEITDRDETASTHSDNSLNPEFTELTQGTSSLRTNSPVDIEYSQPAQWIVKSNKTNYVWGVDQATSKGRITVFTDVNFYLDKQGGDYAKVLENLLTDSQKNIKTAAGGGNANDNFGEDEAKVAAGYDAEKKAFTITVTDPTANTYYGLVGQDGRAVKPDTVTIGGSTVTGTNNFFGPAAADQAIVFTLDAANAPYQVVASKKNESEPTDKNVKAGKPQGVIYVKSTGDDANGDGSWADPFATIGAAYAAAPADGTGVIFVMDDLTVTDTIALNEEKSVIIATDPQKADGDAVVQPAQSLAGVQGDSNTAPDAGSTLVVSNGNVVLTNVIFQGLGDNYDAVMSVKGNQEERPLLRVTGGILHLNQGSLVQNIIKRQKDGAIWNWGALEVDGHGVMNIHDGATIQNLCGDSGSIRLTGGTVNMTGGTITNCDSSYREGSVFYISGSATVNMSGGEITGNGNYSPQCVGTVYLHTGGANTFNMTGGSISGNKAVLGGGVYMSKNQDGNVNKAVLSGSAKITGNLGSGFGVDAESNVYLAAGQTITIGGRFDKGAKVGVYTAETIGSSTDVQFAVKGGDVSEDNMATAIQCFTSDKESDAGVLYCKDGSTDYAWVNGAEKPTPGHHTHAAGTLWLSVAARSGAPDSPAATGRTARSITIDPVLPEGEADAYTGGQAYSVDGTNWYRVVPNGDGAYKLQKQSTDEPATWGDVTDNKDDEAGISVTATGKLAFSKDGGKNPMAMGRSYSIRNKWLAGAQPDGAAAPLDADSNARRSTFQTSLVDAAAIAAAFEGSDVTDDNGDDRIDGESTTTKVSVDGNGNYVATLKTDVDHTVAVSDAWGDVTIDLAGRAINGDSGKAGEPGGKPGLDLIRSVSPAGQGVALTIVDSSEGHTGSINGGDALADSGANGGAGIGTTGGPSATKLTLENATVKGGSGAASTTANGNGGNGGAGVSGSFDLAVNGGAISGGDAGSGNGTGNGGDGGAGIHTTKEVIADNASITGGSAGNGGDATGTDSAGAGGNGGAGIQTSEPVTVTNGSVKGGDAGQGGSAENGNGGQGGNGGSGIHTDKGAKVTGATVAAGNAGQGGDVTGENASGNAGSGGAGGQGISADEGVNVTGGSVKGGNAGQGGSITGQNAIGAAGKGGNGGEGAISTTGGVTTNNADVTGGSAGDGGSNTGSGHAGEGGNGGQGIGSQTAATINGGKVSGGAGGNGGSNTGSGNGGAGGNGGGAVDPAGDAAITGAELTGGNAGNGGNADSGEGGTGGTGGSTVCVGPNPPTISGGILTGGSGGNGGNSNTGAGGSGGNSGETRPDDAKITGDPPKQTAGLGGTGGTGKTPGGNGEDFGRLTADSDSITVNPTKTGWTYQLCDKDGKEITGKTLPGADNTPQKFTGLSSDTTYTVKVVRDAQDIRVIGTITTDSDGGWGWGFSTSDPVKVTNPSHGKITISPKNPATGAKVTITVTPDEGYEVKDVAVTDKNGKALEITPIGDNKYTYIQPKDTPVGVKATIVKSGEQKPGEGLPFTDVNGDDWFYDGVEYVYENGLMAGTSGTTFGPDITTTRGMIVTILYRLEGRPETEGSSYSDVATGQYYTDAVAWGAANGIVKGYDSDHFGPNDPITREQMAAILYRYASYKGYDVDKRADLSGFGDMEQISGYALEPLAWANAEGLVNGTGDSTMAPNGQATRAQVAMILMRFCENSVK